MKRYTGEKVQFGLCIAAAVSNAVTAISCGMSGGDWAPWALLSVAFLVICQLLWRIWREGEALPAKVTIVADRVVARNVQELPRCPDCGATLNTNWGHCPECDEWREL